MTVDSGTIAHLGKDHGVYYAHRDHPGLIVRILIDVVDIAVALVISTSLWSMMETNGATKEMWAAVMLAVWVVYFIVIKWSVRTVGYWLFRVKLVSLRGKRAPFWAVVVRMVFMFIGPLNYLFDLLWMMSNGSRQALRDQMLGTYVVKTRARPAGIGRIVWKNCFLMGYDFVVGEVERPAG